MIPDKKIFAEITKFKAKHRVYYKTFSTDLLNFLSTKYPNIKTVEEQFYLITNNLYNPPTCLYNGCDKPSIFNLKSKAYSRCCSQGHNLKLYAYETAGVENISQVPSSREKSKETLINRYGNLDIAYKSINSKMQKTILTTYGVKNISQLETIKKKKHTTYTNNYGGVGAQSKIIQDKMKLTNLELYGCDNVFSNKETIKFIGLNKKMNHFKSIKEKTNGKYIVQSDFEKFSSRKILTVTCCQCNNTFEFKIDGNQPLPLCYKCNKFYRREFKVEDGISNLSIFDDLTILKRNKKIIPPFELDIYIPDKKIAIEYNGIYWHGESKGKNQFYHQNKTDLCRAQQIKLIQIYESDYKNKPNVVKSIISNKLNKNKPYPITGEINISPVNYENAQKFNSVNGINVLFNGIFYGLYIDNSLVYLISIEIVSTIS